MSVQSTVSRASYLGNGATTTFTVPFYFLAETDISVVLRDNSTTPATQTILNYPADYSVSGAGDQSGGSITLAVAPTASQTVTIIRDVDFTQLRVYVPNDPFPAKSHEQALDKLTMEVQQLQEQLTRCLRFAVSDVFTDGTLPVGRAGLLLGFGADGSINLVSTSAPVGGTLFSGVLSGTADGVNKVFTFTNAGSPISKTPSFAVVWDNFPLAPGIGYALGPGANQLTFTKAPKSTDTLYAMGNY